MSKKRTKKRSDARKKPNPSVPLADKIDKELNDRDKKCLSLLAKCRHEGVEEHRAFLLWAMQTPPNKRRVSMIFNRTSAGIGYWATRFQWSRRRPDSQTIAVECQALYRALYYDTMGESEVKHIRNVVRDTS